MTVFLNHEAPYMRILDPFTGDFIRFSGGRLDLEAGTPEGDRWIPLIMAEAAKNAAIRAVEAVVYCPECGEPFLTNLAKANLAKHREGSHFEEWLADQDAEHAATRSMLIAGREGIACTVCPPGASTFATTDELAVHTLALHANRPVLDRQENAIGGGDEGERAPASVDTGRAGKKGGAAPIEVKAPVVEEPQG